MRTNDEDPTGDINEKIMSFIEGCGWAMADRELRNKFYEVYDNRHPALEKAGVIWRLRRSTNLKKLWQGDLVGEEVRWIDDSDDGFLRVTLLIGNKKNLMAGLEKALVRQRELLARRIARASKNKDLGWGD